MIRTLSWRTRSFVIPSRCSDFLERHPLRVIQACPHADDLPLAIVKRLEKAIDAMSVLLGCCHAFLLVAARVGRDLEELFVTGDIPLATPFLLRNAAHVVFHDRPGRISAEFVAAAEIKLLNRSDQRHIPVRQELEKIVGLSGMSLGDGNHQPHVAIDELVLDRIGANLQVLDLFELVNAGPCRIQTLAEPARPVLQEIHLPEQVLFLLLVQQRHFVKRGELGRGVLWARIFCRWASYSAKPGIGARISESAAGSSNDPWEMHSKG